MSREERAKQFMPFAALKGYPEALRKVEEMFEQEREKQEKGEVFEDWKEYEEKQK